MLLDIIREWAGIINAAAAAARMADLAADLDHFAGDAAVAAVSGRVVVPMPQSSRPTDWERDVAGLERAAYITADIAYRREALMRSGGFDECFPLAYREDADLALRILDLGWTIEWGRRVVTHPVGPARQGLMGSALQHAPLRRTDSYRSA